MPPRPKVNENEIEEKFLKGSGPGGQKMKSQETRSREQNRKIARQILASKLEDLEKGEQSRNNVISEVKKKKKASKRKKSLRKYRKLDEAKAVTAGQITAGDEVASAVAGELEAGEDDEDGFEESDEEGDEEGDEEDETSHDEGDEKESRSTQEQGKKGASSES
ncbi:uncharacterized protein DFL_002372 [Arthrobotrys flagrans]|uniref:Prokaryotic-type class I peptide chain release factors domain-containing protein n=1 Tax=Arthrobotrys flagrans TaxID=97331 RepID=A0A437ABH3_ARTFL|nr:hypothetical protein DFL_002372 [Arthrobotrys flagrans]